MRIYKTDFTTDWEENRQPEIKKLTSQGTIPIEYIQVLSLNDFSRLKSLSNLKA